MQKKSFEIDMCNGPLLGKILLFAIPLMISGFLQLLFNAADIIVLGRFAGHEALAAVGSTGSLVNLLTNVFIGLSVGTNVLCASYHGAGKDDDVSETIHTSVLVSLLSGALLVVVGIVFARPLLLLMGTPDDVLAGSTLYIRIYFAGMPVVMLYNFGAAILRAFGDTRRPLCYLIAAGILNVILNVTFVVVFHMDVMGVALATVISQALSAVLIVHALMHTEGCFHLYLNRLRISRDKLLRMLHIGLPAGLQGAIFSLSNVIIQSSINSFGSIAVAGSSAAANIEGFVYTSMNAFHQTNLSFTSQNYGAGKIERINRILLLCQSCVIVTGLLMGGSAYLFGRQLLGIYSPDPEVISYGMIRLFYICVPYFLCGVMDVMVGSIRGLGYSILPTIVSLTGACLLRIVWICTVFRFARSLDTLFFSYPMTWTVTAGAHIVCYLLAMKKIRRQVPSAA